MFFRGENIQRLGHGECGPPFFLTHSNYFAKFDGLWLIRVGRQRSATPDRHHGGGTEVAICRHQCATLVSEPSVSRKQSTGVFPPGGRRTRAIRASV